MTNSLIKRIGQHQEKFYSGFTKKYNVDKLVYYEIFDEPTAAIIREKQLKKWNRQWKIDLINKFNPEWKDLFEDGNLQEMRDPRFHGDDAVKK
jgi:putative endonuclease